MKNNNFKTRKNIRLQGFDYSNSGMYFITICTKDRLALFGDIIGRNTIKLSKEGIIVKEYIKNIEKIYKNILIDEYIIMPNHIHLIFNIISGNNITISRIIKQYKMYVSKEIGYSIWQKSFYEHIIRNEKEYYKTKEYIRNNIINWKNDKYF